MTDFSSDEVEMEFDPRENYIGKLQEYCAKYLPPLYAPRYSNAVMSGMSNQPYFKMSCSVGEIYVEKQIQGKKSDLKRLLAFEALKTMSAKRLKFESQTAQVPGPVTTTWPGISMIAVEVNSKLTSTETAQVSETETLPAAIASIDEPERTEADPIEIPEEELNQGLDENHNSSDQFIGFIPNGDYAGILITHCDKFDLKRPEFNKLGQFGMSHNPSFKIECIVVTKHDVQPLTYSIDLKIKASVKNIKRRLNFLMLKKLQSQEISEELEKRNSDPVNQEELRAQREQLAEVKKILEGVSLPNSSTKKKCQRLVPQGDYRNEMRKVFKCQGTKDILKSRVVDGANANSYRLLQDIITNERKVGKAEFIYRFIQNRTPKSFPCLLKVQLHGTKFSFLGNGSTKLEASIDGATVALNFFERICVPRIPSV